ncbi:hypothetical protein [Halodesulfovibrio spirochaetisodalis]|uniref:Uncharacterized protein n=1 Tax=Halodesulfovibrio spirochaetisodalis TaxID=1560234 RepID=A0A1B7XEV4_9BACT|nr:hypothetical protein [Halodesulfovibrio spirochaetisodalis]OBQ52731.1 hypothetical protein SP90_07180 [Halodesulfovibrio spirochaetisodalis]
MGGGKGKVSIPEPPVAPTPPPAPPVQEDSTVPKSDLYSSVASNQRSRDSRRATILTSSQGDVSEARVKKSTLLGS